VGAQRKPAMVISFGSALPEDKAGALSPSATSRAERKNLTTQETSSSLVKWEGGRMKAPTYSLICMNWVTYEVPSRGILSGGLLGWLCISRLSSSRK